MKQDYAKIRDEFFILLTKGTDLKLMHGSSNEALQYLKEAYSLAWNEDGEKLLPDPLPAVSSYRLAHMLMREAVSKQDLEDVDVYFSEAIRSRCLGPLVSIYHLAVLHRLEQLGGYDRRRLEEKYIAAIDSFKENSGYYSALNDDEDPRDGIQRGGFNMLELVSYFTALPYKHLEGLGSFSGFLRNREPLSDFLSNTAPWVLLGNDRRLAAISMPRSFATEEMEALISGNDYDLCFTLPRQTNNGKIKLREEEEWRSINEQKIVFTGTSLAYLANTLSCHRTLESFQDCLSNDSAKILSLSAMKKRKERFLDCMEVIAEPKGISREDILITGADSDFEIPMVNPKIKVIGITEKGVIDAIWVLLLSIISNIVVELLQIGCIIQLILLYKSGAGLSQYYEIGRRKAWLFSDENTILISKEMLFTWLINHNKWNYLNSHFYCSKLVKTGVADLLLLNLTPRKILNGLNPLEVFTGRNVAFIKWLQHLVITDMDMPNMTGEQMIVEILKIRQDIPTIICTGYSAKISEIEAKERGISSFAMTPLAKSDLAITVRKVLDGAKTSNFEKP